MMQFASYEFPFGTLQIGYSDTAIVSLRRTEDPCPASERSALSDLAFQQIREYLEGKRQTFGFPIAPQGTPFQLEVWRALQAIPYGETRTYKQIAEAIGNPKACRAVGMANNKNPLLIVVPCHRVIGADGKMVGYTAGLPMKEALLALERGNA